MTSTWNSRLGFEPEGCNMASSFHIRVHHDQFAFCSAHFITFAGHRCEHLHGHNYRVAVELEGPLDDNRYVFDFIALKKCMQEITRQLDHRMLIPTQSEQLQCHHDVEKVILTFETRTWCFPREDCVMLPVANTTAEELANYIASQLLTHLEQLYAFKPATISVTVEEGPGQFAIYRQSSVSGGMLD